MRKLHSAALCALMSATFLCAGPVYTYDTVVLLHGLTRTPRSMEKMEKALEHAGYEVVNIGYPSTEYPIQTLSEIVRTSVISRVAASSTVHFVTHSLGGIILRHIQAHTPITNIGRAVMLSPPNQGSEVVDKLGHYKAFQWWNGPAGLQLGTGEGSFVSELGPVHFELGVITGDRSINWILSSLIDGTDDGKVSIDHARVAGMDDFKIVHATHPFIMRNQQVIEAVLQFLKTGAFEPYHDR